MLQAYNFIGAWQLFPEKGIYEFGNRPKSGIYKIEPTQNKKEIAISMNWVTLENQAFTAAYVLNTDGETVSFEDKEIADSIKAVFVDALNFQAEFIKAG